MDNLSAVESIFFAALDKASAEEQAAYLDQACGHDDALRRRVERLLKAHPQVSGFLQVPGSGLAGTVDEPPLERPGTAIGPYHLLQTIGEGGMGTVYMAEQLHPVRRMVALKIIKPGMDSAQVIARFEAERQALAMMDHPNIARVLDAGTIGETEEESGSSKDRSSLTPSARPYFVMELVKGVPITRFCDENHLTLRKRLELLVPVCHAVQHAHQKGIIHRDLKPSNVLVALYDDKPVPKVIDFGIAKATGQRLTERTLFTEFGSVVGTLEYMSPEQARLNALDIDTRSDVFSLGVLLYELLTGSTPLDRLRLKQSALDELLRLVREEEPPKPSTRLSNSGAALAAISAQRRTEPARLTKLVRGELDWIVMKALEKDRARRYQTANGLAQDLQRYLADEPVEACPPSAGYRLRKFTRKHKRMLTTAAAFVLLLVAGASFSLWLAMRAIGAERDAARQRDTAVVNEQNAQRAREEAETARENLRHTLYVAQMNLVQTAWEADNLGRVHELLEQQRPRKGEADLRGFEWHYWNRLSHAELRTFELGPQVIGCPYAALSSDGTRYVAVVVSYRGDKQALFQTTLRVWDTATGKELHSLQPPSGQDSWSAQNIVMSPDATRFARSGGESPSDLVVWEVASGKKLLAIPCPSSFTGVVFSPDGKSLRAVLKKKEGRQDKLEVKVWDAATGQELASQALSPDGGWATFTVMGQLVISPDGQRVAVPAFSFAAGMKGMTFGVRLWNAGTGKYLHTLGGWSKAININNPADGVPAAGIFSTAFSPDGTRLGAVDVVTGNVKVWDTTTGKETLTIPTAGHDATDGARQAPQGGSSPPAIALLGLVFSPDGKLLIGIGFDRSVRIWDTGTGRLHRTLKGHTRTVSSAVFSPDGKRLYSASGDGTLKMWDTTAIDQPVALRIRYGTQNAAALSPDGTRFAGVDLNPVGGKKASLVVKVLDTVTGQEIVAFPLSPAGMISQLVFSLDGKRLAAAVVQEGPNKQPAENVVRVWDAGTGKELLTFQTTPQKVAQLAFRPDGKRIAGVISAQEGDKRRDGIREWDAVTGQELLTIPGGPYRFSLDAITGAAGLGMAFSPDGKHLAACGWNPDGGKQPAVVQLWDAATGREVLTIPGDSYTFRNPVFSPDGKLLAVAASTGSALGPSDTIFASSAEVRLYDLSTGQMRLALEGHYNRGARLVCFSPDGRRIVTSSGFMQGTNQARDEVKLWDAVTGRELLTWNDVAPLVWGMAFSPDGNRLVAAGYLPSLSPPAVKSWDATPQGEIPPGRTDPP